jgi:glycerol uptake facilitator-like aquaporin
VIGRRLVAEALGTGLLLAAVVGSGIMGEWLAAGNVAVALLANSLATGAALVVLISIFAPLSGAHFNPAVTLYFAVRREIGPATAGAYIVVQILGAVAGVYLAHAMFALPIIELSTKLRDGPAQWLAEFVATLGLLATIAGAIRFMPASTPTLVGLYITAAYWFTASTSFANPAVTIARSLTNTFAGIAPASAPAFIVAQFAAAVAACGVFGWLFGTPAATSSSSGTMRTHFPSLRSPAPRCNFTANVTPPPRSRWRDHFVQTRALVRT